MDKIYISAYADDSFGTLSHAKFTTFQPDKSSMGRPVEKFSEAATETIKKNYDEFIEYESKAQSILDKSQRLKNSALTLKSASASYKTSNKKLNIAERTAGGEAYEALKEAKIKLTNEYGNEWNNCKIKMSRCLDNIEKASKRVSSLSEIIPETLENLKRRHSTLYSNSTENPYKMALSI